MDVRESTVKELLGGERQFEVPLYQRAYSWSEAQLTQLWRDVLALCKERRERVSATHFLGSLVLAPSPSLHPTGVQRWVVVDGQQRLTTLALVLAALRDAVGAADAEAGRRVDELYLLNRWATGADRYKVCPTQADQAAFFAALDGKDSIDSGGLDKARRFFVRSIQELSTNPDTTVTLAEVEDAVVNGLALVVIATVSTDNVHRIFESLNNRGVPLTQGDLLRNYYFMRMPTLGERVHRDVWLPLQQVLDGDELVTLLWMDLLADHPDTRRVDVFRGHQSRLETLDGEDALAADLDRLLRRARAFVPVLRPASERDPAVRRRLERLDRWGARTSYPLTLVLLEARAAGTISDAELETDLLYMESFLVRRLITNHPTNNLNRTFISAAVTMGKKTPTPIALQAELSNPRSHWSTDSQIAGAVPKEKFYWNGRSGQRQAVLSWLEESFRTKEPIHLDKLTIEHVMPQTLSPEWIETLTSEIGSRDAVASDHAALVHTLGNLTLTGYNSEMSNKPFAVKRVELQRSGLRLNQQIAELDSWGFGAIADRAATLAALIIDTWPGPVAGGGAPESTTWDLLEQVVGAIPMGRWATYGDVAAAVGSHPVPVGSRLAAAPIEGAYRVIQADGTISPVFRWTDPDRRETAQEVLAAEGVPFDRTGHAAAEHRLSVSDLRELAGLDPLPTDLTGATIEWTTADFAMLRTLDSSAAKVVVRLLDALAAHPGEWRSSGDLLPRLGIERPQLGGLLGAFTHLVKRQFGRRNWPMRYEWGSRLKLTPEAHYLLEPEVADEWQRSQDPPPASRLQLQEVS